MDEARTSGLVAGSPLPSVRELARRYGVSKGTVESAFKELVREGLCYAVDRKGMFLAKEPPAGAAEVVTTVGLVLNYERYSEETNPFYRSLYEGAEGEAVRRGHNVLTLHEWRRKSPLQKNREVELFREQLAGFVGLALYDERDCLRLREAGVPAVVVDYETQDLGLDCVVIDNPALMTALCRRVLEEEPGETYLADFPRARDYDPAIRERRAAFNEVMGAAGRKGWQETAISVGWPERGGPGAQGAAARLRGGSRRPAVICTDETVARQLLRALGPDGPRAGEDFLLAYVGAERPQHADMVGVPAVIGAVDIVELGREGLRALAERIERGPGRAARRTVGGEVVVWTPSESK